MEFLVLWFLAGFLSAGSIRLLNKRPMNGIVWGLAILLGPVLPILSIISWILLVLFKVKA